MRVTVEIAYKSLNKVQEELCGDKVEIIKGIDSDIIILADGMGSGVKANILATLTSKILGTMLKNGARIDDCVETIASTLPVCKVRGIAYSTFSILQIFHCGYAYLVEFDNPSCIAIRNGELLQIKYDERIIRNKKIRESRFQVIRGDFFILISDGVVHAGVGKLLNFGWNWEEVAEYACKNIEAAFTAHRMSTMLCRACDELYQRSPGDDTTVAVAKIIKRKEVALFTGPPINREEDTHIVSLFMMEKGKKIVCGGTTANIVARELQQKVKTVLTYDDPSIPPIAKITGIDLVTEGVLTLNRVLSILKEYTSNQIDESFFRMLDQKNGASLIAKILIEECTDLKIFVGKAMNIAHQNPNLPFALSIRMNLVEQLIKMLQKMEIKIEIIYF